MPRVYDHTDITYPFPFIIRPGLGETGRNNSATAPLLSHVSVICIAPSSQSFPSSSPHCIPLPSTQRRVTLRIDCTDATHNVQSFPGSRFLSSIYTPLPYPLQCLTSDDYDFSLSFIPSLRSYYSTRHPSHSALLLSRLRNLMESLGRAIASINGVGAGRRFVIRGRGVGKTLVLRISPSVSLGVSR